LVFSNEKYAVQTEEVRNANASRKSDTLIVLKITGNSGGRKESNIWNCLKEKHCPDLELE
jgi:hypothetical protein